jgi:hypothetical protein
MRPFSSVIQLLVGAFLISGLALIPAAAQAETPVADRLTIHGYLSQAWAISDGEQYLGITDDGTAQYRNLALQFRYEVDQGQHVVIQLGHERRGESPRDALRDEVELDWAFYEGRFGANTWRAGRFPMPIGIYAEIRDVGHLLPFYGPPVTVYGETTFSSETVDGVGFSRSFRADQPWSLDLDLFYGQTDMTERVGNGVFRAIDSERNFGGRLWLNTPLEGLRLGLNHHTMVVDNSTLLLPGENQSTSYASLELQRERFLLRSEIGYGEYRLRNFDIEGLLGYVTAGYSPLPKLWVYAQYELRELEFSRFLGTQKTHEDLAASITYSFSERVMLKLEHHDVRTTDLDRLVVTGSEFPELRYTILSLSAAF